MPQNTMTPNMIILHLHQNKSNSIALFHTVDSQCSEIALLKQLISYMFACHSADVNKYSCKLRNVYV